MDEKIINICWFKRDLRLIDNPALFQASKQKEPLLLLYIFEPSLWQNSTLSFRHFHFLTQALADLEQQLENCGFKLVIKVGEALDVFQNLAKEFKIKAVFSCQETWNFASFQRDLRLKKYFKSKNISWFEPAQNGVIRRLKSRDGWAVKWQQFMRQKILPFNKNFQGFDLEGQKLPSAEFLQLKEDGYNYFFKAGRSAVLDLLTSFLEKRGQFYSKEMSSPNSAFSSCSLLSPYIAFGLISIREVFQKLSERQIQLNKMGKEENRGWRLSMASFASRLRWHCHFMQKLEMEPEIEFRALHPSYRNLGQKNEEYFLAWKNAKTGFPMIDACMVALQKFGWINFRMRAMLMSFAAHHLNLPWQECADYLASLFIDFEPGIHYSQAQMQAGITGINAVRIYNPIKQALDHDPAGEFILQHLPQLRLVKKEFLHFPHLQEDLNLEYPRPIIDEAKARKEASARIYGLRKNLNNAQISKKIVQKHASRKASLPKRNSKIAAKKPDSAQLSFQFD
jgi:deoxyribodipyrimidine photo-lyase